MYLFVRAYVYIYIYRCIYVYVSVHVMLLSCLSSFDICRHFVALFVVFCNFLFDTDCLQQWQHMKKRNNKNMTLKLARYQYVSSLRLLFCLVENA